MAVTQYIGARYVPKIYDNPDDNTNNWKQGVEYEPLTMVSYAGGAYTSKVPVPASAANPADAPQYWAYMGSSSGQITTNTNNISRIQHAIANATEAGNICTSARAAGDYVWIDGTLYRCTAAIAVNDAYVDGINITPVTDVIKTLTEIVNGVSDDLGDVETEVSTLSGTVSAMNTALTNKINAVAGLHNFSTRKIVCISDSYGLTPNVTDSWIGKLKTFLNIPDANFFRSQENASGFVGLSETTFLVQIQTLAASMSADDKAAITDFIIGGGMNDAWALKNGTTAADMRTAINSTLAYVRANFPNAIIYLFNPAWRLDSSYHDYIRSSVNLYMQAIRLTTRCCYIEGVNWLHRQALLDSTEYHPNAVGAFCIAESIASVLCGGSVACDLALSDTTGWIDPTLSPLPANVSNCVFNNLKQLYDNGLCYMKWQSIQFNNVAALTNLAQVEIADFTDGIMQGGGFLAGFSAYVNIQNYGPGMLLIYNNRLRLSNFSGQTIPAGTLITVNFGSMCGPVML